MRKRKTEVKGVGVDYGFVWRSMIYRDQSRRAAKGGRLLDPVEGGRRPIKRIPLEG